MSSLTITGALLLLAALSTGARADTVTSSRCKEERNWPWRVRASGQDNSATELSLINCKIKDLHIDSFNGLPNVDYIYLNDNLIEHVDPAVFIPVRNITGTLALTFNKLREVPDFGKYSLFPYLLPLSLSNNLITALDNPNALSACEQLEGLYLGHNNIERIHPDYFTALKRLETLWLNHNKLKIITDDMFKIKTLSYLDLSYNIIEYISSRAFRGSGLTELRLHDNAITQLPVNFASELNRAGARLKIVYLDNNPWQCACLLELLADMRRAGMNYQDGWPPYTYVETKSLCVYTGPYPCFRHPPSGLLSSPPSPIR